MIESAFADYDSMVGLFETAGVAERMQNLIKNPDAQLNWNAVNSCL